MTMKFMMLLGIETNWPPYLKQQVCIATMSLKFSPTFH